MTKNQLRELKVIEGLKALGGQAYTKDLTKKIRELYPDDDGYSWRWGQQSLKKKNVVFSTGSSSRMLWVLS